MADQNGWTPVAEPSGWTPVATPVTPMMEPPSGLPTATALTSILRTAAPAIGQGIARTAANNPRIVQQLARAGSKAVTGGIGAELAGTPGALVGGLMEGFIPTQAAIRETAGRLAGEAPAVAKSAGRAQGIIEYGRSMGQALKPGDIIPSSANPALDAYANSQGAKILRLYGPSGEQVVGPGTLAAGASDAAPGLVRAAQSVSRVLPWLQVAAGAGDLGQMAEPNRRDIGFLGIGGTQNVPGQHSALINALYAKMRDALLAKLQAQAGQ